MEPGTTDTGALAADWSDFRRQMPVAERLAIGVDFFEAAGDFFVVLVFIASLHVNDRHWPNDCGGLWDGSCPAYRVSRDNDKGDMQCPAQR